MQREDLQENIKLEYWVNKISDFLPYQFTAGNIAVPLQEYEIIINREAADDFYRMAGNDTTTMFTLCVCLFGILLKKRFGSGCSVASSGPWLKNKTYDHSRGLLFFQFDPADELTVKDFLRASEGEIARGLKYSNYDIARLTERLTNKHISPQTYNRFGVYYLFDDAKMIVEDQSLHLCINMLDMHGMNLRLRSKGIFEIIDLKQFGKQLEMLIIQIRQNLSLPIGAISLLDELSLSVLKEVTKPSLAFPSIRLDQWFKEQSSRTPEVIAVKNGSNQMTFQELDSVSDRFARYLEDHFGSLQGQLVAIILDHSEWMIASILGILKSGAGYIPIDPSIPNDRIQKIFSDSSCKILITETQHCQDITHASILMLDQVIPQILSHVPGGQVGSYHSTDAIAYVIYTSGSTGNPKGVAISHRNVANYIYWANTYYNFHELKTCLLFTSLGFDLTVTSLFCPLLCGGTITVKKSIEELMHDSGNEHIIKMTPSHLIQLDNLGWRAEGIAVIILGGEAVHALHVEIIRAINPSIRIVNEYGPTETTVGCIACDINAESPIRIGCPADNVSVFIVNDALSVQPVGMAGELYIGGDGVALGYLNNPEMTHERFVYTNLSKMRLYKTSDLARWEWDEMISFIGRSDDQVKVRGYRIELGEIESILLGHAAVKEGAVILVVYNEENHLACYFVGEDSLSINDLRDYLKVFLPDYMIPTYYVRMDHLPLTSNGKVDRKKLPDAMQEGLKSRLYIAPETPLEKSLVEIWERVLATKGIGIGDNFFELGGHSLKVMRVVSILHKELGIETSLKTLFTYPTIERLSKHLSGEKVVSFTGITSNIEDQEYYKVSHAQQRLWILDQLGIDRSAYTISGDYIMRGKFDLVCLERSFLYLLTRHESLRTCFIKVGGIPYQRIIAPDDMGFKIWYSDVRGDAFMDKRVSEQMAISSDMVFDLESGPLLHVRVVRTGEEEHMLMLTMHHIISDGWSMEVLSRELIQLYESYSLGSEISLPSLPVQYKDYSTWQNGIISGELVDPHRSYWKNQLSGHLPILLLPTDYPRPAAKTYRGSSIDFELDAGLVKKLRLVAQDHQASMFMMLVSVVNVLLYRYTGQQDIIIGTPVAGRDHIDLEGQIGFYVNTLALRTQLTGDSTFESLLAQVKNVMMDGYSHQLYPFDLLVDELGVTRDMSRSPVFDVMVVYDNDVMGGHRIKGKEGEVILEPLSRKASISKFDLNFRFGDADHTITCRLEYSDIFKRETMERLVEHFLNIINEVLRVPISSINDFDFIGENEKQFIRSINPLPEPLEDIRIEELFERQVLKYPDRIAIRYKDLFLTYRELGERVDHLSSFLQTEGNVKNGDLVIVIMHKSENLIIALLSLFKCGAAYVPVDPSLPQDRIEYIIEDTRASVVMTDLDPTRLAFKSSMSIVDISNVLKRTLAVKGSVDMLKSDVAYSIYTSGSTGRPKGVLITHRSVVNVLSNFKRELLLTEQDLVLNNTKYSFDISVLEMFLPLISGATLLIIPDNLNLLSLAKLIKEIKPTVLQGTPSLFKVLVEEDWGEATNHLTVLCGGEELLPILANRLQSKSKRLLNVYGPTETTIWSSSKNIDSTGKTRGIGRPIDNTEIYILSEHATLQPIGVIGEITIGGVGLAWGYLNKPELTQGHFIQHQLSSNGVLYRTGDMGRLTVDGEIEFLGRRDFQVKIRGYRIEIGEIENSLQRHHEICEAVVTSRKDKNGDNFLVAYFSAKTNLDNAGLRKYMSLHVPDYMIPSYFVQLPALPVTNSGKVDRQALPDPKDKKSPVANTKQPTTDIEKAIAMIWSEVLESESPGMEDNFFELGGNSLKVIELFTKINEQFPNTIQVHELFSYPTIYLIANRIAGEPKETRKTDIEIIEI